MLAKENRLTKDKEFEKVFKTGRSSYGKLLGIKAVANELPDSRFGILVGIKVSKKAVERNKIKRRIREAIRARLENVKKGFDVVVITLPEILGKDYSEIERELENNLKRLRIVK